MITLKKTLLFWVQNIWQSHTNKVQPKNWTAVQNILWKYHWFILYDTFIISFWNVSPYNCFCSSWRRVLRAEQSKNKLRFRWPALLTRIERTLGLKSDWTVNRSSAGKKTLFFHSINWSAKRARIFFFYWHSIKSENRDLHK